MITSSKTRRIVSRSLKTPTLVGLILISLAFSAWADSAGALGTISGLVTNRDTGKPLSGVSVAVKEVSKTTTTAGDGTFTISGLAAGTYTVQASLAGFKSEFRKVTLKEGEKLTLNLALSLRAVAEKEIKSEERTGKARRDVKMMKMQAPVMGYAPSAAPSPIMGPGRMPPAPQPMNTEQYDNIQEQGFTSPVNAPLSTFSVDVDTASYANVRRFIRSGQMPPKDAVRIEEFVNYFTYDYPDPTGPHPFSVTTEVAECPWNSKHKLVMIGLQGKRVETKDLPSSNLVFLLDVSGSMNSPNKLPLLKQAFSLLVNNLTEKDSVSIVVYAGAAGVVLPKTSGGDKARILAALDSLQAGGSTAGGAGIQLAYQIAKEGFIKGGNNRVILATDGDFNVGVSSDGDLVRMIEERRNDGIFLTLIGLGMGNLKDSRMEKLADKGNGNYAYIDSVMEARKVMVTEMGGTLLTIAKDVKLQLEFNPARVKGYRLVGYENRMLKSEDFNDDKKDAGEMGAGHSVTAFYEIIPAGSDEAVPGVDPLKYQKAAPAKEAASDELLTVKLRYKKPDKDESTLLSQPVKDEDRKLKDASDDFRFATAVTEFAMLLRGSEYKGTATYESLIARATATKGKDSEGYRSEFIELAKTVEKLKR